MKFNPRHILGSLLLVLLLAIPLAFVHGSQKPLEIQGSGGSVFRFPGGRGEPVIFALPIQDGKEIEVTRMEAPSSLARFQMDSEATAVSPELVDSLILSAHPTFDRATMYRSSDSRATDWYLSQAENDELKHYRIYQKGDGHEEVTYEFKNAVLHTTPKGEIQGWYVELPDLSQDSKAKDAPKDLIARAQSTLLYDRIWDLHLHGGENPDFTIPKPVAFGSDLRPLPVAYRVEGDVLNRLVLTFDAPFYPVALDPTLIPALNSNAVITGEGSSSAFYFGNPVAVGDLNSDGKNDLTVTSTGYNTNTGRAYIFYQDSTLWGTTTCTGGCLAASADRIITGQATSNYFGSDIQLADVNNDTKNDLVVGAYGSPGKVHIFIQDGTWGTTACTTGCLAANSDIIITGETGSSFGQDIEVGDLNNDGRADLVVGGPFYSSNTGRVYVFYQDSTLWGTVSCTTGCLASNANHIITGQAISNYFGTALAIGDLNSDGKNDLAVGANGYSSYVGRAYLYYQDSTLWGTAACTNNCSAANADHIIEGSSGSYFGGELAIADINNDTRKDLIVAGYQQEGGRGRIHFFTQDATYDGWGTDTCTTGCLAANADTFITGDTTSGVFGLFFAIGDLNGDTKQDLLVGAQGYSTNTGRAYVFYQDTSWGTAACDTDYTTGTAAFNGTTTVTGTSTTWDSTMVGRSIKNNANGTWFLITAVGGPTSLTVSTTPGTYSGAYTIRGCGAANADAIIQGEATTNYFGRSVAIGDLNNDDKDDIAVGGSYYNSNVGRAYVFYQDATYDGWGSATCTTGCLAANADVMISGELNSVAQFGNSMAIGDLNNDGRSDLVVGADVYSTNAGRLYIFLQDSSYNGWGTAACTTGCLASNADYIIQGTANSYFSHSIAVGDLNSDGRNDLASGAYNASGNAYIFLQDSPYVGWGTVACTNNCSAANADYIIAGETSSQFGISIAIGDLDDDSDKDLLVGGQAYTSSTGRAYVFYQDATLWGTSSCTTGCLAANADTFINGQTTSNSFGGSLAIGDLNGDTKQDLLVGAQGYSTNTGRAYVFYQDTSWGTAACGSDYTTGTAAFNGTTTVTGTGTTWNPTMIGRSIKNNANGTWFRITAVADPITLTVSTTPGTYSGAYTIRGCGAANADAIIQGETTTNYFGNRLAIGDLNNDTRQDIVVCASSYSTNTGRVYLFYQDATYDGWGTAACTTGCLAANADAIIQGETTNNYFGRSVAVGDLNNDGRNELAIGASNYTSNTGRAYVFKQEINYSTGTALFTNGNTAVVGTGTAWNPAMAGGMIKNNTNGTWYQIAGVTDTTHLTLSSSYASGTTTSEAYTIATSWGSTACTTGCLAINADTIIMGEAIGQFLGFSLGIGQLSNDSRADLAVSAYAANSGLGRVYINYSTVPTSFALGSATVQNQAPSIPTSVSDGGSSSITPTNAGLNVSFTATVTDNNSDQWYLLICKTGDAPTPGNDAAPACNGGAGNLWAVSAPTNSGSEATATYTTLDGDLSSNAWYAFACDKVAGTAACSASSQGSGTYYGSPFEVNHRPSLSTPVYLGSSFGSNASVDPATGTNFKVSTSFGSYDDYGFNPILQNDGKIIVVGGSNNGVNYDFALARYNANGTLDTTFDTDGKVITTPTPYTGRALDVAIQTDGKILAVGGDARFIVARYSTAGALDAGFGTSGLAVAQVGNFGDGNAIALQPDGKILASGYVYNGSNYDFGLVRFNSNGTLDTTFDTDGMVTTAIGTANDMPSDLAVQSDGKILVVGYSNGGASSDNFSMVRYNSDGSLDTTFDTDGKVVTDIGTNTNDYGVSVAIQGDGKIIMAGYSSTPYYNFTLVRYNSDGSLDTTFDTDGKVITAIRSANDYAYGIALLPDGRIVVSGYSDMGGGDVDFAVARYNSDGSLDTGFDTDGKVTTAIGSGDDKGSGVTLQPDGKIVVTGWTNNGSNNDFALIRYTSSGGIDVVSGGDVYGQAPVLDSDSDLVTFYACSSNSFSNGMCTASTLCAGTALAGSNAQCIYTNAAPIPTASGTVNVYLFAKDQHGFASSSGTAGSYSITNVAPMLIQYASDPSVNPPAGGAAIDFHYLARLQDNNGEGDITLADGVFFEDTAVNNNCTSNEQNCYLTSMCNVNTAYGNNTQVEVDCIQSGVWFTSLPSTNWEIHVNPTDGGGLRTTLADSDLNIIVPYLGGISTVESSLNYGTLNLGALSSQQSITVQNAGNVATDVGLAGTDMTYSTDTIPRANQHWSGSAGFGYNSGYALVESAIPTSASTGCFNANLATATVHTSMPSIPVYWLLLTPESIKSGTYTGANSMSLITCQ